MKVLAWFKTITRRVFPSAERVALISAVNDLYAADRNRLIEAEIKKSWSTHRRAFGSSRAIAENYASSILSRFGYGDCLTQLAKYSDSTLKILAHEYSSREGIHDLLWNRYDDELSVREHAVYFPDYREPYPVTSLLEQVSDALEIKDLTSVPESQRAGVSAALHVAFQARSLKNNNMFLYDKIVVPYMTPELAGVIMEQPHNADRIVEYIASNGSDVTKLDIGHLCEFLGTAAPLGAGAL